MSQYFPKYQITVTYSDCSILYSSMDSKTEKEEKEPRFLRSVGQSMIISQIFLILPHFLPYFF